MKYLLMAACLLHVFFSKAQVKIGDNPGTIDANSLLEMETTNKGFLPPRVTLTSLTTVSPLTGTVPAGMTVFNGSGSLPVGFYYWTGTEWKKLDNGYHNLVEKSANATLLKNENFVLASNDITLTLPVVTNADNGLQITIKNYGTYTDLVTVEGSGGATVDGLTSTTLTRYVGKSFIAYGGNWVVKHGSNTQEDHILDVDESSSWTTVDEVIAFLDLHMTGPTVIRLADETVEISETVVVDLPYAITFQGLSYGTTTVQAATGLTGKPMFRCLSEVYFKMLSFDATTLASYGTVAGEDAIRLLGSGTYNEVKDCSFDGFYNTILDSTDAELWVFECDISNSRGSGILVHGAVSGVIVKVAETDFIGCNYGVNLSKGSGATIQLASGGYYNANSGDTAIFYQPANFTTYSSISITGNSWNNTGKYIEGFDFTRSDGRDANVIMESNAGVGDASPSSTINVLNNATTTTVTTSNTWYKGNWTNTSSSTTKWTIANNRVTYQPTNRRNGWMIISGNLSCNNANRTISLGIVKNGSTGTRFGETTLRITTSNQPFQFSTVVYLTDIAPGDYFEIFCTSTSSFDIVTFQDVLWLTNTK
jgi:hypothetical protein